MAEISIIIPFVNEYPQIMFTIRAIANEFKGRADFEILAIDNYCPEFEAQKIDIRIREEKDGEIEKVSSYQFPDRSGEIVKGSVRACSPWLKYLQFTDKLSHWNAKNVGIQNATGEFLYFVDAHVSPGRDSIWNMFRYYRKAWTELNGTIALPLTYKILENRRLIYKLRQEPDGTPHYSFTPLRRPGEVFRVPCMSACGVMMHRSIMEALGGGWPELLGIYGGGENFLNFTLAVLGYTVNIYGEGVLHHHGDPRSYYWNWTDYKRNRAVANYMAGGKEFLDFMINGTKGDKGVLNGIRQEVLVTYHERRADVRAKQKQSLREYFAHWFEKGALPEAPKYPS